MKWKKIINTISERVLVDGINYTGEIIKDKKTMSSGNGVLWGVFSEGMKATGRKVTKDQILAMFGLCAKSGTTGAVIDGIIAAHHAKKEYDVQNIDEKVFLEYVTKESACGFISSASGSAGTVIVALITGGTGPAAIVVGIGASIGSRYLYRIVVDDVLERELKDAIDTQQDTDRPAKASASFLKEILSRLEQKDNTEEIP